MKAKETYGEKLKIYGVLWVMNHKFQSIIQLGGSYRRRNYKKRIGLHRL